MLLQTLNQWEWEGIRETLESPRDSLTLLWIFHKTSIAVGRLTMTAITAMMDSVESAMESIHEEGTGHFPF